MSDQNVSDGSENEFTFEEAFGKLGEMVQTLEGGNLSLEEATRLYEDGMKMAQKCNELLNKAELRVNQIQESFGEQIRLLNSDEPSEIQASTLEPDILDEQS